MSAESTARRLEYHLLLETSTMSGIFSDKNTPREHRKSFESMTPQEQLRGMLILLLVLLAALLLQSL